MTSNPPIAVNPQRDPSTDAAWRRLLDAAAAPYRGASRFAWHFARGKLGRDPVFRALLERGQLAGGRVVDIGCGQGLMASLLQSAADLQRNGAWPAAWPTLPQAQAYTGIELMATDVRRAEAALAGLALAPRFVCADMREAALPPADLVVILDVLHYVDHAAQQRVLERVRAALAEGGTARGRLLLRVGDMDDRRGFRISQWVDHVVTLVRGHRVPPTWGRSVADWRRLLETLGFVVQVAPMSAGTPFANTLLVADLRGPAGPA
jgi:SAM-dependent methyltransferase